MCVFCVVQLTCFLPWINSSLRTAAWARHLQASGALVCVQRGPSLQASRTGGHPGSVLAHMQSLSAASGPLLAEGVGLPPPKTAGSESLRIGNGEDPSAVSLVLPTRCVTRSGPGVSPRQEGLVEREILALVPQNPHLLDAPVPSCSFQELEVCLPRAFTPQNGNNQSYFTMSCMQ